LTFELSKEIFSSLSLKVKYGAEQGRSWDVVTCAQAMGDIEFDPIAGVKRTLTANISMGVLYIPRLGAKNVGNVNPDINTG